MTDQNYSDENEELDEGQQGGEGNDEGNNESNDEGVKVNQEEYELLKSRAEKADELADELAKLKNKDLNFKNLKNSTEDEKKRMKQKIDKKAQELENEKTELEKMRNELDQKHNDFVRGQLESVHKKALDDLCGDDSKLRARVEHEAKTIVGGMNNEDQIREKYEKAYLLATGDRPQASQLHASSGVTSGYSKAKARNYTETEQGKQNYGRWFPDSNKEEGGSKVRRHFY